MKASDFKLVQTWDNIVEQVKQTNPAIGCFLSQFKGLYVSECVAYDSTQ